MRSNPHARSGASVASFQLGLASRLGLKGTEVEEEILRQKRHPKSSNIICTFTIYLIMVNNYECLDCQVLFHFTCFSSDCQQFVMYYTRSSLLVSEKMFPCLFQFLSFVCGLFWLDDEFNNVHLHTSLGLLISPDSLSI